MEAAGIAARVRQAAEMLMQVSEPAPGEILVLGASTSEVQGENIGSATSEELATAILNEVVDVSRENQLYLAVQCCEHLNRALVVERDIFDSYELQRVSVIPTPSAGGGVSAEAYRTLDDPVIVQGIAGHLGIDIGDTFIAMHLRPVVVPVRIHSKNIGRAHLTMARTRPPLIGGERGVYPDDPHGKRVRHPVDC